MSKFCCGYEVVALCCEVVVLCCEVVVLCLGVLLACLFEGASTCLPKLRSNRSAIPGWNELAHSLRHTANFWHKLWSDCGCPSSKRKLRGDTNMKYVGSRGRKSILGVKESEKLCHNPDTETSGRKSGSLLI